MDRLGKAPTRIYGIESISQKETRDIGASKVKKTDQRDKILRERQQSLEMKNKGITDESSDGCGKVPWNTKKCSWAGQDAAFVPSIRK